MPKTGSNAEDHYPWEQIAGIKAAVARDVQSEERSIVVRVVAAGGGREDIAGSGYVGLSIRAATVAVECAISAVGSLVVVQLSAWLGMDIGVMDAEAREG
jgi:hypothetical protein